MAEAESGGDKSEAATPKRREEAREQGNFARSQDLSAAALLVGGLMMLRWSGGGVKRALTAVMQDLLSPASLANASPSGAALEVRRSVVQLGVAVAPLLGGVVVIAVLANVAQSGLSFNPARLTPRFEALNPARGVGRLFSGGQGLVRLGLSLLKLTVVGATAYSAIHSRIGQIILVGELSFTQIFGVAADVLFAVAIRIGVLLLVLAVVDYVWQRYRLEQTLKMTKQEIKDEMRNMEGDPHVKQRRRQMAVAALKERLKVDVPKADVVVTNPTEFAIALQYDPDAMAAPRVIAKGQGVIAARIREIAMAHGVPILERKPLARALYKLCDVGAEVPEQFFSAIAEILAYVYELNGRFKAKHVVKAG